MMSRPAIVSENEIFKPPEKRKEVEAFSTKMQEVERAKASVQGALKVLGLEKFSTLVVDAYYHEGVKSKDIDALVKSPLEKKIKEENFKKAEQRKQAEREWALQKTPLYRFSLLAQLASHESARRINELMQWSLTDLQTVLREVASKTTLGAIPSYRFEEAKQDLLRVIEIKANLEPSKDVEETSEETTSLLRKVIGVFRGH